MRQQDLRRFASCCLCVTCDVLVLLSIHWGRIGTACVA